MLSTGIIHQCSHPVDRPAPSSEEVRSRISRNLPLNQFAKPGFIKQRKGGDAGAKGVVDQLCVCAAGDV